MSFNPQNHPWGAWSLTPDHKAVTREWVFESFGLAMAFVQQVAEVAHAQDHHPDMVLSYNVATVSFSTHSVQGLSVNDFICAAQVSALPEAQP